MAEWETIQERLISGKGVLKVPSDVKKNRAYVLFATVVRQPKNKYLNFNWNPARSRYGNLVFLREDYVIATLPLEFSKQVFDGVNDVSGQTLIAVKCAYEGILQTFVNLSIGLAGTPGGIGLAPISYVDQIKDYENLRLAWDEIRLQCYADTAISLRLDRLVYDTCDADKDKDKPPPPPPPSSDPVPPGTPIEVDPPYDFDTNDDGNTDPFPDDATNPCAGVGVWRLDYNSTPGGAEVTYFKGRVNDTFELVLESSPGCLNGQSQNLYSGGVKIYDRFTCTSRAELTTSEYFDTPPSGVTVTPNPRYPDC